MTMSRGLTFEFEDVIAAADDRVVLQSDRVPTSRRVTRALWRARNAATQLVDVRPSLGGDDFVFVVAQSNADLADHLAHRRLIKAAHKSAAYIEELWIRNHQVKADVRHMLGDFDHIFVGCEGTVEPLAEALDRPVTYLPPSVDQLRFGWQQPPTPLIDVYAMGRRQPDLHEGLLRWASDHPDRMYHFDTFTNNPSIVDHTEHRRKLADFIRRCRYFIVNEAKTDQTREIEGQSEVGYRFFEGAAAGTVMLGVKPTAPAFERLFGWDDAVIGVEPSGSDIGQVIETLDQDPQRRDAIRRRNLTNSMRRHDPAHRWRTVLETVGLEETAGITMRIDQLAERADAIGRADVTGCDPLS